MKKLKKELAVLLLAVTLVLSEINIQSVSATGFTDVKSTDWYYSSVTRLVDLGITSGIGNNRFAPNDTVTRSEFVTFLCKATGLPPLNGYTFTDTKKHWSKKWISAAISANIIDQDLLFNPDEDITRQEAAEMLCRSLDLTADTLMESPFCDVTTDIGYSTKAFDEYLMLGSIKDNERYFYPFNSLKRSEVSAILVNLVDYKEDKDSFKEQKKAELDKQEIQSPTTRNIQQVEVTVSTADELIKQIGSNKKIQLKSGIYNLSSIKQLDSKDKTVSWQQVDDGKELNLSNIHNLTIEGLGSQMVEIKVNPRYAEIINFQNCKNITLKNIKAGHTPSEYTCNAGVLCFTNCSDITINNSELYGCGSVGITLQSTKRLNCVDTIIDHCSLRAVSINRSEKIKFTGCKILNHEAYSNIVNIFNSKDVTFEQCELTNNNYFEWSFFEVWDNSNLLIDKCKIMNNKQPIGDGTWDDSAYFFKTTDSDGVSKSQIKVKDTKISNNKCDYFYDDKDSVTFENCTISGNEWKVQPITDDDLELSNYKLHMTIDKFEKDMPKDLMKKSSSYDDTLEMTEKTLEFRDGTIFVFLDDTLYSISTQNPQYSTPRGLQIGDSIEKLIKLYGNPQHKSKDGCWEYTYEGGEDYTIFYITVANDKVSKIQMSLVM